MTAFTVGIFGLLIHGVKNLLFLLPTLWFSMAYESGSILGQLIAFIGLPFAFLGSIVSSLIGHSGDMGMRVLQDSSLPLLFPDDWLN